MKNIFYYLIPFVLIFSNCKMGNNPGNYNSPLAVVIKLNAAEELRNFDEAKKYQNIQSIYGEIAKKESKDPEKLWHDMVDFFYNISRGSKFTNLIVYYNYNIREVIDNNNAEVILIAKNSKDNIKSINYTLKFEKDSWIVEKIEYKH